MTHDELLQEAKRRYPIGTKVRCLSISTDIVEITSHNFRSSISSIWSENLTGNRSYAELYDIRLKQWAEIIESPANHSPLNLQLWPLQETM